jgi:hypothetical protein
LRHVEPTSTQKSLADNSNFNGINGRFLFLRYFGQQWAETESFMWLYRTGYTGPPIVLFEYQPTREGEHPRKFLMGFKGYLHVDGYPGYHGIEDAMLVGCWAHARRKFDEAIKGLPSKERKTSGTKAREALEQINRLFLIERELQYLSPEERLKTRDLRSRPVVEGFRKWLDEILPSVVPKSLLGVAVKYGHNQWQKLIRFLEDGRLEISNNRAYAACSISSIMPISGLCRANRHSTHNERVLTSADLTDAA